MCASPCFFRVYAGTGPAGGQRREKKKKIKASEKGGRLEWNGEEKRENKKWDGCEMGTAVEKCDQWWDDGTVDST